MEWEIIDTGVRSAEENMRIDAELLETAASRSKPLLHFYDWAQDSATYGYFVDPADFLNMERVKTRGLALARRPTGGGIVFHLWDMAFSVLVPAHCPQFSVNTLENYAFVNQAVLGAVGEIMGEKDPLSLTPNDFVVSDPNCGHFCMAKPTKYDLIWKGKKVAGAAQRKTKSGFLHQGTIALLMPPEDYLKDVLLPGTAVADSIKQFTCPLLGVQALPSEVTAFKETLRKLLATHLNKCSLK